MNASASNRPDPDALLRNLDSAAALAQRGKLRLYFGASAGVGKTFAMLSAARAAHDSGTRVLAGVIETHGRKETAALLEGLPLMPRVQMQHQGHVLPEFDLDGVLAAKPEVVLVDELAHANAAGARHSKRWQDVLELLSAGIDVWTTLNAQHLESLNNAVSSITGIQVWETVPDAVFDDADEVILIDLSADELLRRLQAGKVYMPEQARHAMRNFFRKGNLIALRELALRRTAEHVEDDVQAYRQERSIDAIWRTREAVLACVGGQHDAEHIVRSAHQLARQLECDLHVVTIETVRVLPLHPAQRDRLARALALATTLNAHTETLSGLDMVAAVAAYVKRHNITKAVLGRSIEALSARQRWQPMVLLDRLIAPGGLWRRRSFSDALAAHCPQLDVIRLAAPAAPRAVLTESRFQRVSDSDRAVDASLAASTDTARSDSVASAASIAMSSSSATVTVGSSRAFGYGLSLMYCAVAAAMSSAAFPTLHQTNVVMLFLVAVVAAALRHGRGPAAFCAIVSVAAFDFLFVPPLNSFAISDVQYLVTFVVLLAVGLLIGQLMAGLRAQALASAKRENDARGLYEFARELSSALLAEQIVGAAGTFVRAAFQSRCALFILGPDDRLQAAASDVDAPLSLEPALAQWVFDHGQMAGAGTQTLSASNWLYLPLKAPMRTRGVLAVETPPDVSFAQPDARRHIDAYATLIAIALERLHYVEIAQEALINMASEQLRNTLLATLSHDLRTPLTSLVGMSDTLLQGKPPLAGSQTEIVQAMRAQALRMHAMAVNLLYMARLQNRNVDIRLDWQSLEELVGAALADSHDALEAHRLQIEPMSSLPLLRCDGVLIGRVLCNLVENAAKYSPVGSTITLSAREVGQEMEICVADEGIGVAAADARRIFEKFTRGDPESSTPGVGLGLAVCEMIVGIHHGRIWTEPRSVVHPGAGHPGAGHLGTERPDAAHPGARFLFTLPLVEQPVAYAEPL